MGGTIRLKVNQDVNIINMSRCCKLIENIHREIVEQHLTVDEFFEPNSNIRPHHYIFEFNCNGLIYSENENNLYLDKNMF